MPTNRTRTAPASTKLPEANTETFHLVVQLSQKHEQLGLTISSTPMGKPHTFETTNWSAATRTFLLVFPFWSSYTPILSHFAPVYPLHPIAGVKSHFVDYVFLPPFRYASNALNTIGSQPALLPMVPHVVGYSHVWKDQSLHHLHWCNVCCIIFWVVLHLIYIYMMFTWPISSHSRKPGWPFQVRVTAACVHLGMGRITRYPKDLMQHLWFSGSQIFFPYEIV